MIFIYECLTDKTYASWVTKTFMTATCPRIQTKKLLLITSHILLKVTPLQTKNMLNVVSQALFFISQNFAKYFYGSRNSWEVPV